MNKKEIVKSCNSLNQVCERLNIDMYKKVRKSKDELMNDIMQWGGGVQ